MHISEFTHTLYPDFQVLHDEVRGLSQYKQRQVMEGELQAAREATETSQIKSQEKYIISLPTEAAHAGHPVGVAASFLSTN